MSPLIHRPRVLIQMQTKLVHYQKLFESQITTSRRMWTFYFLLDLYFLHPKAKMVFLTDQLGKKIKPI